MQINEFVEATAKLEVYYDKEYTKEQRLIMYEELSNLDIERYRQIIKVALRTCKYMPKLSELIQIHIEEPYIKKQEEKIECSICNGEGFVFYKKIIKDINMEYDYACRCTCKNGLIKDKNIPTYEELGLIPNEKMVIKESFYERNKY